MEESKLGKLSDDEKQRIENLNSYGILNTSVETRFDAIVFLACLICDLPMAAVSFIDHERQIFKSKIGIVENQIPREKSLCNICIQSKEILTVSDATLDNLINKHSIALFDPQIKFYMGVPIVSSKGFVLGTLAVMDKVPRGFSEKQINGIKMLASQVNDKLEVWLELNNLSSKIREFAHVVNNHATVIGGSSYILKDLASKGELNPELIINNSIKIKNSIQSIVKTVKELRELVIS